MQNGVDLKALCWLAIGVSIICAAIVIATAGGQLFNLNIDSAALLVTTLGILVTVLIGYQIYNSVQVDQRCKDVESRINDEIAAFKNERNSFIQTYQEDLEKTRNDAIGEILSVCASDSDIIDAESFLIICRALVYMRQGTEKDQTLIRLTENRIIDRVNRHIENNPNLVLCDDALNKCCSYIEQGFTDHRLASDLIASICGPQQIGSPPKEVKRYF